MELAEHSTRLCIAAATGDIEMGFLSDLIVQVEKASKSLNCQATWRNRI